MKADKTVSGVKGLYIIYFFVLWDAFVYSICQVTLCLAKGNPSFYTPAFVS